MNDVLGREIKKGNFVIISLSDSSGGGLGVGIVLDIFTEHGQEKAKIVRAKQMGMAEVWEATGRVSVTFSDRLCLIAHVPVEIRKILNDSYSIFWKE